MALISAVNCVSMAAEAQESRPIARIINGTRVSNLHSPVVEVNLRQDGALYLCTGSLIAPKVVLTAWHCVGRRASAMSVVIAGKRFAVARFKVHPHVSVDRNGRINNDLALLFLAKPPSVPRLSLLTSRKPAVGDTVTVIGYGLDEYGWFGFLRLGTARIDGVTSDFVQTLFQSYAQANSCGGDSGGPAILSYLDDQGQQRSGIIGTVSTGTTSSCLLGDRTFYVNIQSSAALRFILSNTRGVRLE